MRIYLGRHGQTDHNVANLCSGDNDVLLNAYGERQAHALGKHLKTFGIQYLYSSDLFRAIHTSSIVNSYLDCPIELCAEIRERNFGKLEGLTSEIFMEKFQASGSDPEGFRPEGGENYFDVKERIQPFIRKILAEHSKHTIAIIAHSNLNRAFLATLLGGKAHLYTQDSCCYNVIDIDDLGQAVAVELNSTIHLKEIS